MDLKPGYKQTEVGVIPEDWEVVPYSTVTDRITVGIATSATHAYRSRGIPMFRNQNIKPGRLEDSEILFIDSIYEQRFQNKRLKGGDLLTARTGYPGTSAIVPDRYAGAQSFTTLISTPKPTLIDRQFLCCVINSWIGETFFEQVQIGGGQKNVGAKTLRHLPIPLPPTLAEQEAIAEALSDADAFIDSLEQVIAKKRLLKQGAMQDLLTGKRRLPGFEGEWEVKTLGDLVTFLSGGTPSRSNEHYWAGDIPWISASSLRCFFVSRSDQNVTREAVVAGSKMAPVNSTLLLVRGSALHNEILCGLVTKPVCFNQDVKALIPNAKVVPIFLTILIKGRSEEFLSLVSSAGNTAGVLDTKLLKIFEIALPAIPEQTAIAAILSDMDAEIAALEAKLAKARQVKQGMMQELLTGTTRLK